MRLNTMITLGASAAFGLMAVFLARGWINGAVENEFRDTSSDTIQINTPARKTSPVLVANIDLQFGDVISLDTLKIADYPEDSVPFESFGNYDSLFSPDENAPQNVIALTSIRMNEPILPHKISGPNGKGSLSARIAPGYRAASIRVDAVTGVSGFVVPGDLVDIIYTATPISANDAETYSSDIILQSVQVLAIDQNQSDETSAANLAKTVTLEVSHEDAQRLSVATQTGHLSLILRGLGETTPATTRAVTTAQISKSSPHKSRYKQAAKKPRVKFTPKAPTNPVAEITIIRGDNTESVSVISEAEKTTPVSSTDLAGG